jgi:hypothetical protein
MAGLVLLIVLAVLVFLVVRWAARVVRWLNVRMDRDLPDDRVRRGGR